MSFKILSFLALSLSLSVLIGLSALKNSDANHENATIPILNQRPQFNSSLAKISPSETASLIQDTIYTQKFGEQIFKENWQENWDLSELPASAEALAPFFEGNEPDKIVYFSNEGIKNIYPRKISQNNSHQTLFLSTQEYVKNIAQNQSAQKHFDLMEDIPYESKKSKQHAEHLFALPNFAYDIAKFFPGTRADNTRIVPIALNYREALNGPDYSFENFGVQNESAMRQNLQTVLPLGNNGILVLKIRGNGAIIAKGGNDFSVYQTTFLIEGTDLFWHKFAQLGVSDTLNIETVKWFPCDPQQANIASCVGTVPTEAGGDQFNLADIGVSQASYIWIKDIGTNKHLESKWPTEGCAIDALRIYHAYITQ